MKREFYGIGSEVYFINDEQKVDWGRITGIDYNVREVPNSCGGFSSPYRESTFYMIDDKYRRKGEFVFKSREELIKSL